VFGGENIVESFIDERSEEVKNCEVVKVEVTHGIEMHVVRVLLNHIHDFSVQDLH
jgi:hypothetical protein